jgi:hypothetical protein
MARRKHQHRSPPPSRLSVYDGQLYQGYVVNRADRWAAFTAAGEPLGTFPDIHAAVQAVALASRGAAA